LQGLSLVWLFKFARVLSLVGCGLLLSANAAAAGGKIRINEQFSGPIKLSEHVFFLVDSTNEIRIEQLRAGEFQDGFVPFGNKSHTLGFSDNTYWLAFQIDYSAGRAGRSQELFIKNNYPLLDETDIYFVRQKPDPAKMAAHDNPALRSTADPESLDPYLEVINLGELRPFANNRFVFPRPIAGLQVDQSETIQVFIRIRSSGSKIIQFSLESESSMLRYLLTEGAFISAFYAVMAAMVLYNLFVFLAVREKAYFYYVLAIFTFATAQFALDGLPWAFGLFETAFWTNQFLPTTICVAWVFMLTFVRSFLQTRVYAPVADQGMRIVILFYSYWCFLAPLVDYNTFIQVSALTTVASCMIVSVLGAYIWRRGNSIAGYFMFAWMVYMGGAGILLLNTLGLLDTGWLGIHSSQLGSLGNVILLSLALADNINTQKRAMEVAIRQSKKAQLETQLANERAQFNLARFRQIWENAREGIFQCSLDGRFISANPTLASILGYESNQALLESISNIGEQLYANPSDRLVFEHSLESDGRVEEFESQLRRQDGSLFWSSSSAHMVRDETGKPAYIEGTLVDISERMEKEKAQRDREAAEASTAAKSEFLANMSHEIRTPMNAIIGFTDLALRSDLSPRQKDYLSKINTSARNLLSIINDILDFSKIEAGRLELESTPFDLETVSSNIIDLFADRASRKGLELTVFIKPGVPRKLIGDPLRLGQVLINLVGNSLKFTSEGEITLVVEPVSSDDYAAEAGGLCGLGFSVKDTGIGIPRSKLEALFTPFTQLDGSTTRRFGGTGLGLSISKQIVELMGGSISVSSEVNEGSDFRFTIFLRAQDSSSKGSAYAGVLQGTQVLLIDDADGGRQCMLQMLESAGCSVRVMTPDFDWEHQIIETLGSGKFDLCIIDRHLQAATTEQISEMVANTRAGMPVVVGALQSEEHLLAFVQEEKLHLLRKPFDEKQFIGTLLQALGLQTKDVEEETHDWAARKRGTLSGHRVLLVEDTFFNQQLAIEYLEDFGLVPDLAGNGEEALHKLEMRDYAAVLMDCQMPVMDGYEATRRIRQLPEFASIPIIAMTANAMKGDREKCLAAGMSDYLSKPIDPEALYDALAKVLSAQPVLGQADASQEAMAGPDTAILASDSMECILDAFDAGDLASCSTKVKALKEAARRAGATELVKGLEAVADALQGADQPLEPLLYLVESQLQTYITQAEFDEENL
jgi:PAS domain S-box-containing protein